MTEAAPTPAVEVVTLGEALVSFVATTPLRAANACGASAVASSGDMAGLPERAELDRLLATGGPDTLR